MEVDEASVVAVIDKRASSTKDEDRLANFVQCIHNVIRIFVLLLDYKAIASLYVVFPLLRDTLKESGFALRRHLLRLPGPGLRVESFGSPLISEFVALCHFYEHAENSHWKNETGLLCRKIDGYHRFLVSCPTNRSTKISCVCFLRPSSPSPFQNALLVCDTVGSVTLYVLERERYRTILDSRLTKSMVNLACSPRGSAVVLRDVDGYIHLLMLDKNRARLLCTEVKVSKKAVRREMFVSESEILVEETNRNRHSWVYSVDKEKDYCMTKRRFDNVVPCMIGEAHCDRPAYVQPRGERPEMVIYSAPCSKSPHSHHDLVFCQRPRDGKGVTKRRRLLHFAECVLVGFRVDRMYKTVWVAVLTMRNRSDFLGNCVLEAKASRPCFSKFDRRVIHIGIYSVCLEKLCEEDTLEARPRFFAAHDSASDPASTFAHAWRWYRTYAQDHAIRIVMQLSDRFLLLKMTDSDMYLFPVATVQHSVYFAMPVGANNDILDTTAESNYLAILSSANYSNGCITVLRFCPLYPGLTIEEATRCRTIPANIDFDLLRYGKMGETEGPEADRFWRWRIEGSERQVELMSIYLQMRREANTL